MKKIPQDVIGNIAILKFKRRTPRFLRKFRARRFLKQNKNVTTVLEKTEKFSGRLRTLSTSHLAGIKTKETTYKENGCIYKFNVDETYFSPRLSNERKVIAESVEELVKKNNSKILVMFAGVAPYPIAIAKQLKQNKKHATIYSNELNRKANEYAKKNVHLNKLNSFVEILPGDANKLDERIKKINQEFVKKRREESKKNIDKKTSRKINEIFKVPKKFDIILMPRPNLKDTFLKSALKLSKKGTTIFYHGFGTKEEVLSEIKKDTKGKVGKISIRKAGDIGPKVYRWQAQFKVK